MASITTITMLLFLAICATLATAEQRFAETPAEYQEVSQGQDVKLRCRVQDKRGQCIWQKDRFALGMVHDKYEWDHGDAGECSLVIKRASLDYDDGLWECQVTPGDFVKQDGLRSPPARLLVRGKRDTFIHLLFFSDYLFISRAPHYRSSTAQCVYISDSGSRRRHWDKSNTHERWPSYGIVHLSTRYEMMKKIRRKENENRNENEPNENRDEPEQNQNADEIRRNGYNLRDRGNIQAPARYGIPIMSRDDFDIDELFISEICDPENYNDAIKNIKSNEWKKAMREEIDALHANNTWTLVDPPDDAIILKNRWVFKTKNNNNNTIYRARLVVKGFQQRPECCQQPARENRESVCSTYYIENPRHNYVSSSSSSTTASAYNNIRINARTTATTRQVFYTDYVMHYLQLSAARAAVRSTSCAVSLSLFFGTMLYVHLEYQRTRAHTNRAKYMQSAHHRVGSGIHKHRGAARDRQYIRSCSSGATHVILRAQVNRVARGRCRAEKTADGVQWSAADYRPDPARGTGRVNILHVQIRQSACPHKMHFEAIKKSQTTSSRETRPGYRGYDMYDDTSGCHVFTMLHRNSEDARIIIYNVLIYPFRARNEHHRVITVFPTRVHRQRGGEADQGAVERDRGRQAQDLGGPQHAQGEGHPGESQQADQMPDDAPDSGAARGRRVSFRHTLLAHCASRDESTHARGGPRGLGELRLAALRGQLQSAGDHQVVQGRLAHTDVERPRAADRRQPGQRHPGRVRGALRADQGRGRGPLQLPSGQHHRRERPGSLQARHGPKPRQQDQLDGHGHSTLNGQGMSSLGEIEETTSLGLNIEPFECPDFDANPPAQYRWLHQRGGSTDTIDNRNSEDSLNGGRRLRLENVGWSDEGEYRCVAYNVINGVRREMPSDVRFVLHVIGPPEIQSRPSAETEDGMYESIGWAGEAVHRLKSRFCSRPPPRIVAWQWGSSHIRAGEISRRIIARTYITATKDPNSRSRPRWKKVMARKRYIGKNRRASAGKKAGQISCRATRERREERLQCASQCALYSTQRIAM
ncbi:unnamed protein product [Trichogramma brassicae]|uniref:Ig-like domain-containing protein n=1 Tax=Trichogramma brassicae TaxID=86971 RepID=A0A6H5IAK6_9HYME|nr:unnamed protein product [Trichogramma brassicae]